MFAGGFHSTEYFYFFFAQNLIIVLIAISLQIIVYLCGNLTLDRFVSGLWSHDYYYMRRFDKLFGSFNGYMTIGVATIHLSREETKNPFECRSRFNLIDINE